MNPRLHIEGNIFQHSVSKMDCKGPIGQIEHYYGQILNRANLRQKLTLLAHPINKVCCFAQCLDQNFEYYPIRDSV